jgi:signal transduction histidine kinase
LLSNAFKFTPAQGTVTMRIRRIAVDQTTPTQQQQTPARQGSAASQVAPAPSAQVDEYNLRIEVEDSGAGISKENQVSVRYMFVPWISFSFLFKCLFFFPSD